MQGGMQPRITNPEGQTRQNPSIPFVGGGGQKSLSPSESQGISTFIKKNWSIGNESENSEKCKKKGIKEELKFSRLILVVS